MKIVNKNIFGVTILTGIALAPLISGCAKKDDGFLGSAVIEAETWQVPALVQGPLLAVLREEGDAVRRGDLLAVIDTLPYALQYAEAEANLRDLSAGTATQSSQIRSLQADAKGLEQEAGRARALSQSGASTPQQVDKAVAARDAARYRVEASKNSLQSLEARRQALQSRLGLLANQLERCRILAPADGRVLTRYRNPGEAVSPGQSVFEIGRSDSVHADFFVPQAELSTLRLGDTVRVRVGADSDAPGSARALPAIIRFISSEAEFTPKNIQTRESRAELIFRVRAVSSSGNGALKRGLPVEIWR
jgi:HlyD family secretion protein